jgi:hypothetical protein
LYEQEGPLKLVKCHARVLQFQTAPAESWGGLEGGTLTDLWDPRSFPSQPAIHELLFDRDIGHCPPLLPAAILARNALGMNRQNRADFSRVIVWIDPGETLYPPGIIAAGIPADRLCLLRVGPGELVRAAVECLGCEAVAAVVSTLPPRVSRVEVRRLQLAAERGKCVGILLRAAPRGVAPPIYAAASRWLISPARGQRSVQRWNVRLIHGHGGHLGQSFLLEKRRDSLQANIVHLSAPLAHQPTIPKVVKARGA